MSLNHFIYLVIICAAPLQGSSEHEDYYSSIGVLGKLLELEHHLLHNLRDYVDQEVAKNQQIALILEDFESENAKALNHSQEYFGNPINVFKTIKRSVVDLRDLGNYILDGSSAEFYRENVVMAQSIQGLSLPDKDDLRGAVVGLDRLLTTYKLDTSELGDGNFYGVQHGPVLSTSDSFAIAADLFEAKEFDRSLEWFLNALEKFNNQLPDEWEHLSRTVILEWICAAAVESKKPHIARSYLTELLLVDPNNQYARMNEDNIEVQFFEARNAPKYRKKQVTRDEPSLDLYYKTCRGERKKTPTEERPLRCKYVDNDNPYLRIGPFKMEQLSLDPLVVYFHEVIYENEIQQILNATAGMTRSQVGETTTSSPVRTSKNTWLDYDDHEFLIPIGFRIVHMTALSEESFEALQLANYGIGGHYVPHYDFAFNPNEQFGEWMGNRIATALFYLSDVEFGGATAFPSLKLAVQPIRGSMVLWYNVYESGDPDNRTRHGSCPVLKGSKWILTQWIHERGQEFLRPCGLQRTPLSLQDSQ